MTTASEFRCGLLDDVSCQDAAQMVSELPTEKFGSTLSRMAPFQLANILYWMSEWDRQRAIRVVNPQLLREAYTSLSLRAREYLRGTTSLALWADIARAKDSEIQAWAQDIARGRPGTSNWVWKTMDREAQARVALAMTDEQLETLLEQLKC